MNHKSILTSSEIFERIAPISDELRRQRFESARTDFACFASMMADDHTYRIGDRKLFFNVSRAMWEVGRNPNLRTLLVVPPEYRQSVTGVLGQAMTDDNGVYKNTFPDVTVSSLTDFRVEVNRSRHMKDASIYVVTERTEILGSRIDLILCDDPGDVTDAMRGRLTSSRTRSTETI